jgi:pimeloyl-ACP methyl ester carboxylesterase
MEIRDTLYLYKIMEKIQAVVLYRFRWPNETIREGVDYSMAEQLDDLRMVVDLLNASPAHLVGHSFGAFLSLFHRLNDALAELLPHAQRIVVDEASHIVPEDNPAG